MAEDPGVISVSTGSYRLSEQPSADTASTPLDGPPPGLKHPLSAHDHSLESLDTRGDSVERMPLSAPISPHKDTISPDTTSIPEPIELPSQQKQLSTVSV